MIEWFNLVKSYSLRDQLSFMYCIWKNNIKLLLLDNKNHKSYLKILKHKNTRIKNLDWKNETTTWIPCFDPYENRQYFFNIHNRLCKWNLNSKYSEELYKFLELGYKI